MENPELQRELTVCFHHPDTYKLEFKASSFDEILKMFSGEILQGCSVSDAESVLVNYVTSIIEPVGWTAVWRPTSDSSVLNLEYDFIVEVVNVSLQKLEADVYIKSVILENSSECVFSELKKKINIDSEITVPLIELYTISENDDDELFAKTAIAIENARFCMTHLSRPWDGEEDDITYSEKILSPRLQLYFDMQNNLLPKTMVQKIKSLLKEGWKILKELNILYSDMNVSDSEAEINEDDLLHSMSLRTKLSELQAKMEILENPVIRSFMMKKYVPRKSSKKPQKSSPVVYIVSKQFTYDMISNLQLESSSILEFEHNPEAAFKSSSSGDKILIFPGVYRCDSLGWIEGEITVEGIGLNSEIILEATGNSEVFLNCCSDNVLLKNLCLKAKAGLLSVIVIHHGEIHMNDCIINSNRANIGVLLLGGSAAFMKNSTIHNSCEDGIQMRSLSTLHMISSKIHSSERHGIQIDADIASSDDSYTEVNIKNSVVSQNGGNGIFLNNVPLSDISLRKPSGEFSILKFFPWLKSNIEDSEIDDNKQTGVGVSSLCKNIKDASYSSKVLPTSPNPDDFNCSALSDLLHEISFTDLNIAKCEEASE